MQSSLESLANAAGQINIDLQQKHIASIHSIFHIISPSFVQNASIPVLYRQQAGPSNTRVHEDESHRVSVLRQSVDEFRVPLDRIASSIDALKTPANQEATKLPVFPSLKRLEDLRNGASDSIKPRIDTALNYMRGIQTQSEAAGKDIRAKIKSTESTLYVTLEIALEKFWGDLLQVTDQLRQLNSQRMAEDMTKLMDFAAQRKSMHTEKQKEIFGDILSLCTEHQTVANHVARLIGTECSRLLQADRERIEKNIHELTKNSMSYFQQVRLYYEQKEDAFVFQPLSPIFYTGLKKVEMLMHHIFVDFILRYCRGTANPQNATLGGIRPAVQADTDPSTMALSDFVRKYAEPNPQLFTEGYEATLAGLKTGHKLGDYPQRGELNQLLWQWVEFHRDATTDVLAQIKKQKASTELVYADLVEEVRVARQVRDNWFNPLPPGAGGQEEERRVMQMAMNSPEVVKLVNGMSTHIREVDAKISTEYRKIGRLSDSQIKLVEETTGVDKCVRFLSQWTKVSDKWEQLIVKERAVSAAWKAESEAHAMHMAIHFTVWNHHTMAELGTRRDACEIFTNNCFESCTDLRKSMVNHIKSMWLERDKAHSLENTLLDGIQSSLRDSKEHKVADAISVLQTEISDWTMRHQQNQLHLIRELTRDYLIFHKDSLMNCLSQARANRIKSGHGSSTDEIDNPIIKYLEQLDGMYHSSLRLRDQQLENARQLVRDRHVANELSRIEKAFS